MGCRISKVNPINETAIRHVENDHSHNNDDDDDRSVIEDYISPQKNINVDDEIIAKLTDAHDHVQIQVADQQAFSDSLVQQRQQAIDNHSYRSTIDSWQPTSLQQLVETMKTFSNGKSLVDRHWIIFYWIAVNIEYDTVSYFAKDYKDQSAEGVFQRKKGVCAGYANLYEYLCRKLQMPCEIVGGYAKGYGFDDREGAPTKTDHAWNAVEIDRHWYLMESTWGTGHLNKEKAFERKLKSYYFLPRPDEMIYHHLAEVEKWQLLQTPIKMNQYLQMPKIHPTYFELNLELIHPHNQAHVDLLPNKPYALVLIRAPSDVHIIAALKLNDQKIEGGHRVIFDNQKQVYSCYFAPSNTGKHKIIIYGARGDGESVSHSGALDLTLDIKQIPKNPISFPKTWKNFFDLGLDVISPTNTHLIKIHSGTTHTQIQIKTSDSVELRGRLTNDNGRKIEDGVQVYYDRQEEIWRCKFAPDQDGIFEALLMAKRKSDPGSYSAAVSFKIEATQIPFPPDSYPETWQLFYDLDMKIVTPQKCATIIQPKNAFDVEIHLRASDDVELHGRLTNSNKEKIEGGHQVLYDQHRGFWICKFAPNRDGIFEALIMAKRKSDPGSYSAAVSFKIEATQIPFPPDSYPETWQLFYDLDMKIVTPQKCATIIQPKNAFDVEIHLRASDDVELHGRLTNSNKEKIEGGHQVLYDQHRGFWICKFAPNRDGIFEALIMAKRKSDPGSYSAAVSFKIEATQIPFPPDSYPETWQLFYDLDMKIVTPQKCATIIQPKNAFDVEIHLRASDDVELHGRLTNSNKEKIEGGHQVLYDQHRGFWICKFAPNRDGIFEALIMAKRKSDTGSYTSAVSFKIDAKQIPSPPISYPKTWPLFYDLGLKLVAPQNRGTAVWPENASYAEILIQAPDDVELSCNIKYNNVKIENGSLSQFDNNKKVWQLLFAPETIGSHKLIIFAKRNNDSKSSSAPIIEFGLDVTKLRRPMKFPFIYTQFQTRKCQIYTPLDGILKKGSIVPFRCVIPGAIDVNVQVDSKWLESKGYADPIFQGQITVGSKEVVVYGKYGEKTSYSGLIKYTVQ